MIKKIDLTKPVSIYCLVDPRNQKPFYVGSTNGKLSNRKSGHTSEAAHFVKTKYKRGFTCNSKKCFLLRELAALKLKPKIRLLLVVSFDECTEYEIFFYDMLIQQGFDLLQSTKCFIYTKKIKAEMRHFSEQYAENQPVRAYGKIYFKNTLIFIW